MTEHARAKQAAIALQGDATGQTVLCPGPGHSPRDRSLAVTFDPAAPDGFLVHSFAGDDWRTCRDHVATALGVRHGDDRAPPAPRPAKSAKAATENDRKAGARRIWAECKPLTGSVAERYLSGRGCLLSTMPRDLRYHPALRYDGDTAPGLVAAMRDIRTNEITGVHRTFLRPDGSKIDRRMLGVAGGAVVKLTPDEGVTRGLGIAEGIETGLAIMRAGFSPVWACLSAGALASFPVLPGIECLTVFADHDASGTGQSAAGKCVRRWREAGREAHAIMPISPGDFNDTVAR